MMETIHLPTFRGLTFSCGFCTQKLNKINLKKMLMYFNTLFIKPNNFYINIFHSIVKKIAKVAFFEHRKWIDPLRNLASCVTDV